MEQGLGNVSWESSRPRSERNKNPARQTQDDDYWADDQECNSEEEQPQEEFGGESWGACSRSSAKHAARVMAKFDDWKRKQVEDAGFGGLLNLQQINLVNRRYTTWLLGKVCPDRRILAVGKNLQVKLTPKNVNRVLGLPCEGLAVCPMEDDSKEERDTFVQIIIGAPGFEDNPVVGAEHVISQAYTEEMKRTQADTFITAFVVWIVGTFLAPTTSHKSKVKNSPSSIDFWGALQKADAIKDYNWAEYVLEHLLDAARKAQEDMRCKSKVSNVLPLSRSSSRRS